MGNTFLKPPIDGAPILAKKDGFGGSVVPGGDLRLGIHSSFSFMLLVPLILTSMATQPMPFLESTFKLTDLAPDLMIFE